MAVNLPKMTLWYHPKLRSTRCVWLIKELGIEHSVEYKYVPIGPTPMCPEREEYKERVHPHGLVPALEIEGRPSMFESGAICMYLVDLYGRLGPEPSEKSEYYNWMFYCTSTLDGAMSILARQWMFTPKEQQDSQVISKAKALVDLCLDSLNAAIEGRQFLLGDRYTKYVSQQSLYQASYEHPDFVELPSFIREYETQSLNMYVPPDESTPSYGEVGVRIHGDSHRVVDVHHSSPISGVVAAVNPMFQFDQHTSQSEQHSSIHSTTSLGESTTIL